MSNSMTVFFSGIIGVFFGMTLLYFSVILTGKGVDRLEKKRTIKKKDKTQTGDKQS